MCERFVAALTQPAGAKGRWASEGSPDEMYVDSPVLEPREPAFRQRFSRVEKHFERGCTQALLSAPRRCIVRPGREYVVRGRRNARKTAAEEHLAAEKARVATGRADADKRARRAVRAIAKVGGERGALEQLSRVSLEIERLHREELKLLEERDALVDGLRSAGRSWNALSSRTRLSRQALMKRAARAPGDH